MLIGLWIVISPIELAFKQIPAALWNNISVGIAIAVLAAISVSVGYKHARWRWCNGLLGGWLTISPFVLGFASNATARWNNLIVGAVAAILAWID